MQAKVRTVAFQGIDVLPVDVQVQIAPGSARLHHGRPGRQGGGREPRAGAGRVPGLGLALPPQRITVNLAPADLAKEGSHYDLPIALGLVAAMGVIPRDSLAGFVALGELALDGSLCRVPGVLPAAIAAAAGGARPDLPRGLRRRGGLGGFSRRLDEARAAADPRRASLIALVNHFAASRSCRRPRRCWPTIARAIPTSPTSRARKAPSARWRSPRPAATTC